MSYAKADPSTPGVRLGPALFQLVVSLLLVFVCANLPGVCVGLDMPPKTVALLNTGCEVLGLCARVVVLIASVRLAFVLHSWVEQKSENEEAAVAPSQESRAEAAILPVRDTDVLNHSPNIGGSIQEPPCPSAPRTFTAS